MHGLFLSLSHRARHWCVLCGIKIMLEAPQTWNDFPHTGILFISHYFPNGHESDWPDSQLEKQKFKHAVNWNSARVKLTQLNWITSMKTILRYMIKGESCLQLYPFCNLLTFFPTVVNMLGKSRRNRRPNSQIFPSSRLVSHLALGECWTFVLKQLL